MKLKEIITNNKRLEMRQFMNLFRIYLNNELVYSSEVFSVANTEFQMLTQTMKG